MRLLHSQKQIIELVDHDPSIPSIMRDKYKILFAKEFMERLKVNMNIIDFNYTRLNQYIRMLIHQQQNLFGFRTHEIQCIDEKEYPLALEYYLQFDRKYNKNLTCARVFHSIFYSIL